MKSEQTINSAYKGNPPPPPPPAKQPTGNARFSYAYEFTPSGAVLAWLRSRSGRPAGMTPRTLLADPRSADDAITLKRWGCEVTVMFSRRNGARDLRETFVAEGIECITGDFFDLKTSWRGAMDLVIFDNSGGGLPKLMRQTAIRLLTTCLNESGRLIVVAATEAAMEASVRAAAPHLMMLSSESGFDPHDGREQEIVVAQRTGVTMTPPKLPLGLIKRFPL